MLAILLSIYSLNTSLLLGVEAVIMGLLGLLLGIWLNYLGSAIPKRMEQLFWGDLVQANAQVLAEDKASASQGPIRQAVSQELGNAVDTTTASVSGLGLELLQVLWSWGSFKTVCKDYANSLDGNTHKLKWRVYSMLVLSTLALPLLVAGFGYTAYALIGAIFFYICLLLVVIDWETQLLPDFLVYILLWSGLIWQTLGYGDQNQMPGLIDAILGAVAGYFIIFITGACFFWLRGIQGIGLGDAKLLAALGVWCGWQLLPQILLTASLCGLTYALLRKLWMLQVNTKQSHDASTNTFAYIPNSVSFGPFLIMGAIIAATGVWHSFMG